MAGGAGTGQSVLEWLLAEAPDLALAAVGTGVAALWWPDSDSGAKATAFCRYAVQIKCMPPRLYLHCCKTCVEIYTVACDAHNNRAEASVLYAECVHSVNASCVHRGVSLNPEHHGYPNCV